MTITMTRKTFTRTESGKSWKSKPESVKTATITETEYNNRAGRETIKFWNGFLGGTCRAEYGYSYIGYTPLRITLVNPSRAEKIVETYRIEK